MHPVPGSRPGGGSIVFKEVLPLARRPGPNSRRTQAVRGKQWILSIAGFWPSIPAGIEALRRAFRVSKRANVSRRIARPAESPAQWRAAGVR